MDVSIPKRKVKKLFKIISKFGEDLMKSLSIAIACLMVFSALAVAAIPTMAQTSSKITIAIDLAHGETTKMVNNLTSLFPNVNWVVFGSYGNLTSLGKTITLQALNKVNILLIGDAPSSGLTPTEVLAIKKWLNEGHHVLWISGDSDYGSGAQVQIIVDNVLSQLGAHLRIDYCEVDDSSSNCGHGYRVAAWVPPQAPAMIRKNMHLPVLAHGPGPLAYVDDKGYWHSLELNHVYPPDIIPLLITSDNGTIADENPPPAVVYNTTNITFLTKETPGEFPVVAAELMNGGSMIIVAGASIYGDYAPMLETVYHGIKLQGPQFIKNVIQWSISLITGKQQLMYYAADLTAYFYTTLVNHTILVQHFKPYGDELYKYPTNTEYFKPGVFDLAYFAVYSTPNYYKFVVGVRNLGGNPWKGPNGFCLQHVTIYIHVGSGGNTSGIPGSNIQFASSDAWKYAIDLTPGWTGGGNAPTGIYLANGKFMLGSPGGTNVTVTANQTTNVIIAKVPKSVLGDLSGAKFVVTMGSYDGYGVHGFRTVAPTPEKWKLGGNKTVAKWVALGIAPRIIDVIGPKQALYPNVAKKEVPTLYPASYYFEEYNKPIIPAAAKPTSSPTPSPTPTSSPTPTPTPTSTPTSTGTPTPMPSKAPNYAKMGGVAAAVIIIIIVTALGTWAASRRRKKE